MTTWYKRNKKIQDAHTGQENATAIVLFAAPILLLIRIKSKVTEWIPDSTAFLIY